MAAARLIARAEYLGLLDDGDLAAASELGVPLLRVVLSRLAEAGVGRRANLALTQASTADDYRLLLDEALEQVEASPMPAGEWRVLTGVLGEELLAELVGVSPTSVRRYVAGSRLTPDAVALRLHYVALLVADLAGGYNDYGMRRWFVRPRAALGGRTPRDVLGGTFDPDSPDATRVRQLAEGLLAAGAA